MEDNKPAMALARAAKAVRKVDCTTEDGGVHPVLHEACNKLREGLEEAGIPVRTWKKVLSRFREWARNGEGRFPQEALDALVEVPVKLESAAVWELPCLTEEQAESLMEKNLHTYRDICEVEKWDLLQIPYIGEKTIRKLDRLERAEL